MVIIEKPCVDIPLAQGSLYGRKVHGQTTILTTSAVLGELAGLATIPGDSRPRLSGRVKLGNCCQAGLASIFFRAAAGKVSHAVLNTSRGAFARMLIR